MRLLWLLAVVVVILGSGCKRVQEEESGVIGPQFSAKNGLLLPEETRRSLGLQVADVMEQKGSTTIEFEVRAYAREGNVVKASGMVQVEQARFLKPGQEIKIQRTDGEKQTAKVAGLSEQLRKATGQVEALVEIPDAAEQIKVGTLLSARFMLEGRENVATIPRSALLECTEGSFVYTVSGEHLVRTAVKVGAVSDETVEINDGLLAGDQVVVKPVMTLWLTELAAVKGGQACCIEPPKGK